MISSGLLVAAFAALASARPASQLVQHERRDLAHDAGMWVEKGSAPRDLVLPVWIAVTQQNIEHGYDLLMDVADPASSNFGKHWTKEEVDAHFAPHKDATPAITGWLASSGIGADRYIVTSNRGRVGFNATVAELESLLRADYRVHTNAHTGEEHVFCDSYHVPADVQRHVDYVTPTISTHIELKRIDKRGAQKKSPASLPPIRLGKAPAGDSLTPKADTCYNGVTPACIRSAYGIPSATLAASTNNLGIFEDGDIYDQADLNGFWSRYATYVPQGTGPTLKSINGAKAPESQSTEANEQNGEESLLDFEIAIPLIYPQKTQLFQVNDNNLSGNEIFADPFLDAVDSSYCSNSRETCGAYKATNVVSVSYGLAENSYSRSAEVRQCNEYMKLGLQGVSIIYASGDSGVASRNGCLNGGGTFNPGYPATCPYVTSVGATMINNGASVTSVESAVSDPQVNFYSGGGFSNYFARPSYQNSAVSNFLTNHNPGYSSSVYNASGRGFPDVAALGINIINYDGGQAILQGGTSASAPIFASIINLINEQRIKAGKKPVGFLNPTLYANPSAFTDIVSGNNPGCGTNGFSAVSGWDPVTGLGTPKYSALQTVLLNLS